MLNIFTPAGASIVGDGATQQPKTDEQISPVQTRLKWFETPLAFIGTIVLLLVAVAFVERKVV